MFWISLYGLHARKLKKQPTVELEPTDTAEELEPEPCETQMVSDADDGFDPFGAMESCEALEGYVQNNEDCNDRLPSLSRSSLVFADGDGFGSIEHMLTQCTQPDSYVYNADDCDDWDSNKKSRFYLVPDTDGDGYGAETQL